MFSEIEQCLDIEDDQETLRESIDAFAQSPPNGIERGGTALEVGRLHLENLANGVDHEAVEFAVVLDDDAHLVLLVGVERQAKPRSRADCGHDTAAKIE